MPFSVDLKPCQDCGDDANCALRQFKKKVEASIAVLDRTGEEISVDVPDEVVLFDRAETYYHGFLKRRNEVFKCAHDTGAEVKGQVKIVYNAQ